MKTAGIIGGLGPASTIDYYRELTDGYRRRHGDDRYPEMLLCSVDMHTVVALIEQRRHRELADMLIATANRLAAAGADFAAIASNSPHVVWDLIDGKARIPFVSIVEAVCGHIAERGYRRPLVFATAFTMRGGLYADALARHGIESVTPEGDDVRTLGDIIYPNLENGIVVEADKARMTAIAERYIASRGCDSLLLGCTEIPLMIHPGDVSVPVVDSTRIHIEAIGREIEL